MAFYVVEMLQEQHWNHVGQRKLLAAAILLAHSRTHLWHKPTRVIEGGRSVFDPDAFVVLQVDSMGRERRPVAGAGPASIQRHADHKHIESAVRKSLSPELLHEPYRSRVKSGSCDPMTGHCYVASEAAYHMLGGKTAGWTPMFVRHEGSPHWFLRGPGGKYVDITASQFKTPVPYDKGVAKGFLTRNPSARARAVIDRARAVSHSGR